MLSVVRDTFVHIVGTGNDSLYILLEPLTRILMRLTNPLYSFNHFISSQLGQPDEAGMYLLVLLFSILFSCFYRILPQRAHTAKHLYNLVLGLLFVAIQFGWTILHPLVTCLVCYGLMRFKWLPSSYKKLITFIFMFVHCSLCQLYELSTHYGEWRATFTATQMMMVMKCISVVYNLADGEKLGRETKVGKYYSLRDSGKRWEEFAVVKTPNLIQYLSYCFYFGGVNAGPVYEYKHYRDFVEKSETCQGPFQPLAVLGRLGKGLFNLGLFVAFGMAGITLTYGADDLSLPLYALIWRTNLCMLYTRTKYYFAWSVAEAGCVAGGLGWDPNHKENKWRNVETSFLIELETATSVRTIIIAWNCSVSKWLRHYVYFRLAGSAKLVQMLAPMVISAFWHGFYPGYYFFWVTLVIVNLAYQDFYKKIFPRLMRKSKNPDEKPQLPLVTHMILTSIAITLVNHIGIGFNLLDGSATIAFYSRFHWMVHIGIIVVWILLKFVKAPKKKSEKKIEQVEDDDEVEPYVDSADGGETQEED